MSFNFFLSEKLCLCSFLSIKRKNIHLNVLIIFSFAKCKNHKDYYYYFFCKTNMGIIFRSSRDQKNCASLFK